MRNSEQNFDLTFLNKISGGDKEFVVEMINTFKEIVPEFVNNSKHYLEEKDYESLSREAHKFLPGVSFLGIKHLEGDIELIEDYAKHEKNIDKLDGLLSSAIQKVSEIIDSFDKEFNLIAK